MIQAVNSNQNSVLAGTVGAGIIGAGVYGTSNLLRQNFLLSNPNCAKGLVKDVFNKAMAADAKGKKILADVILGTAADLEKIVNSGKINWKMAGKAAGSGALVIGTAYLLYRGIKALLTPKTHYIK